MGQHIHVQEITQDGNESRLDSNELAGQLESTILSSPPASTPIFQTEETISWRDRQTLQDIRNTFNSLLPWPIKVEDYAPPPQHLPPTPTQPPPSPSDSTCLEELQNGDQELWELL